MANCYIRASTELTLKSGSYFLFLHIHCECFFAACISLCRDAVAFGNFHIHVFVVWTNWSNPVSAQISTKLFTSSEITWI